MPAHEIKITIPELFWEECQDGSTRFFAEHDGATIRAKLYPTGDFMTAEYRAGEHKGDGSYSIDSPDDLLSTLGHLLMWVAGVESRECRAGFARAAFGGGKVPVCVGATGDPQEGDQP